MGDGLHSLTGTQELVKVWSCWSLNVQIPSNDIVSVKEAKGNCEPSQWLPQVTDTILEARNESAVEE